MTGTTAADGKVLAQNTAHTRRTADKPVRFVMVGDLADGKASQNVIAARVAQEKPDFLVALGTHAPMSDEALSRLVGRPVVVCDHELTWDMVHFDVQPA